MTDSPSLLLQRAAELIEQRAAKATPGPWRDEAMGSDGSVVLAGGYTVSTARRPARCGEFADATWIAMANPLLAQPLASILRDAAFNLDCHPEYRTHYLSYIALAEAVLGTTGEQQS